MLSNQMAQKQLQQQKKKRVEKTIDTTKGKR
jgi:hypothetical protein